MNLRSFLVITHLLVCSTFCEYITSSQIKKCYATSSTSSTSEPTNCSSKLVVVLTLENGQIAATESISATLKSAVTSSTSSTSTSQDMKYPFIIEVTKSPVTAIFPLKYKLDFNNQPRERLISTSLFSCNDGYYDTSPTCEFQHDSSGKKILDSQGFCCYCSLSDILGFGDKLARGNVCYALNLGSGSATASCLQFDPLWYSAYEISSYELYFEVIVKVYKTDSAGKKTLYQTLASSTSNPTVKSTDGLFVSKIIGTFTPTKSPADLSSYYLVKPTSPSTHSRVLEGTRTWMFLDKTLFTLDGTECNKIGVSYSAFRNEYNQCSKPIGSCLKNQLDNYYQSDLALLLASKTPRYLMESQGSFKSIKYLNQSMLNQVLTGSMSTLLTLEMNAADIEFITNLASGKILSASINNFESQSGNGKLTCSIESTASFAAEFILAFACSSNVQAILAAKLFLESHEVLSYKSAVNVLSDAASKGNSCNVTLSDSIGNKLDSKILYFNTTAVATNTNQNGNNSSDGKQAEQQYEKSCDELCTDFWNFICSIANGCWAQAFKSIGTILGIIASVGLVAYLIKKGCLSAIVSFISGCCCRGSSTDKPKKSTKKKNKKQSKESTSSNHQLSEIEKDLSSISLQQMIERSRSNTRNARPRHECYASSSENLSRLTADARFPLPAVRAAKDLNKIRRNASLEEFYANIDCSSSLFSDFTFIQSFSFSVILDPSQTHFIFPSQSPIPQLVNSPERGPSASLNLMNRINSAAIAIVTQRRPLYPLADFQ